VSSTDFGEALIKSYRELERDLATLVARNFQPALRRSCGGIPSLEPEHRCAAAWSRRRRLRPVSRNRSVIIGCS